MTTTAPAGSRPAEPRARARLVPGLARLFAFGALVGSFLDGFHTHGGATAYPHPIALEMAWWTPPLFGIAFVLLGLIYRRNERPRAPFRPLRSAVGFGVFSVLYFASGFLPAANAVKLAVLLAGAAGLFAFVDRSRAALVTGLAGALAGPAFEVVLVHAGAFLHLQPDFLGIPRWLPALYLASGPGVGALASRLLDGSDEAARRAASD